MAAADSTTMTNEQFDAIMAALNDIGAAIVAHHAATVDCCIAQSALLQIIADHTEFEAPKPPKDKK
jgi:hypothetical protein